MICIFKTKIIVNHKNKTYAKTEIKRNFFLFFTVHTIKTKNSGSGKNDNN